MHILLRYRLEKALMAGELQAADLPTAWQEGMSELLGVDTVPSDAEGCLQDVHWSALLVGYFPSYLLGAVMAAQLWHYAERDPALAAAEGGLEGRVGRGDFAPLQAWLNEKVHVHGSRFGSMDELLLHSLGEPLNPKYLLAYLTRKYSALYALGDVDVGGARL